MSAALSTPTLALPYITSATSYTPQHFKHLNVTSATIGLICGVAIVGFALVAISVRCCLSRRAPRQAVADDRHNKLSDVESQIEQHTTIEARKKTRSHQRVRRALSLPTVMTMARGAGFLSAASSRCGRRTVSLSVTSDAALRQLEEGVHGIHPERPRPFNLCPILRGYISSRTPETDAFFDAVRNTSVAPLSASSSPSKDSELCPPKSAEEDDSQNKDNVSEEYDAVEWQMFMFSWAKTAEETSSSATQPSAEGPTKMHFSTSISFELKL